MLCLAGDRYLLKLFRDFVLHQVREDGTPVLDWGHVVECLNKLNAGVPEKVLLFPSYRKGADGGKKVTCIRKQLWGLM